MGKENVGGRIVGYAITFVVTSVGSFVGRALYDGFMTIMEGRKAKKEKEAESNKAK